MYDKIGANGNSSTKGVSDGGVLTSEKTPWPEIQLSDGSHKVASGLPSTNRPEAHHRRHLIL